MAPPAKPVASSHSPRLALKATPSAPRIRTVSLPPEDTPVTHPASLSAVRISHFLSVDSDHLPVWDLAHPDAATFTPCHPFEPIIIPRPATEPSLQSLTITCRHLPRWSVKIDTPSSSTGPLSVLRVLRDIHLSLRVIIDHDEYSHLSPEKHEATLAAYRARWNRVHDPWMREVEHQTGVRRIDLLGGAHFFDGLSTTVHGHNVLELHVR
jgi:hypothetical protein